MYRQYINSKVLLSTLLLCFLLLGASKGFGQDPEYLIGKVVDENGLPVVGAVVNVTEQSRIALSDKEGVFKLKGAKLADEVSVTCVGYLPAMFMVETIEDFKVTLEEDRDPYAHTAPLPFKRMPKKFITAATSTVGGDELEKYPITVLQNAFTSTVTGVATYEAQSEPGWSETDIYIRGIRTMNESARSPLIIVDNVERDLSFLDAYPIESITILKDAAATSIYGMRGANGVVMVTTRRGTPGKTTIKINQEFGFQALAGLPESQNSYNYAMTRNQALYLDGLQPEFSDEDLANYKAVVEGRLDPALQYKYFNTNWHKTMLRDVAPQYKTNLSISGGNNRTRYYVGFTYLRQEGLYDKKWTEWNSGYSTQHLLNRYNLRSNVDIDLSKHLSVSLDLGGRIDDIDQPGIDVWNLFTWGAGENKPIFPVFTPNGHFFMPTESDSKNGAAQIAGRGFENNRRRNLYTNISVDGKLDFITKGLRANVTVGFDSYETFQAAQQADIDVFYYNFMDDVKDPSEYKYTRMRTGKALPNPTTSPRDYYYNVNLRGGFDYNRTFADKHIVNAQAFVRSYQNVVRGQNSSNRYLSYNLTASYVYDSRYVLSGNLSHMGSDNFISGDRWDTFWGLSGGWVLSEESWLKDKVDLLKLRVSYGRAGQAVVGGNRYPYQGTFSEGGGYNFGTSQTGYPGAYESATGNRNIKWELSDMLNVGADFDLWGRKLYGSVDVFKEWRSDILVARSTIPDLFGAPVPLDSYGKVETKGVEVTLGHTAKFGDFSYFVEGMVSWNRNKITEMDELDPEEEYQRRTGKRIGQSHLLIFDQWANNPDLVPTSHQDAIDNPEKYPWHAAGQYKMGNAVFQDTNGDRIINNYDKVPHGYTNIPEVIPSIRFGVEWKGIDARAIFTGYLNRTVGCRENMDYGFGWGGTSTHAVTKTWGYYTDDPMDSRNINAKYPRLSTRFSDLDRNYPFNESTIWVVNGNFWSLRNVEVGYSLPQKWVSKLHMTKLRVYFNAYNLFTWSDLPKNFDPENPTNYLWAYPKTKTFSFGLNIVF